MITYNLEEALDAIEEQSIVGVFQGQSEWGPRALGNRSLVFDPRNPDAKDIVNRVKGREAFRPFAGSILLDHVHKYFKMGSLVDSPYMTYSIPATHRAKALVPSIIHVDGTCRIQTVTRTQNKGFYELIEGFYERTGCPILFNTSFNLGGETIVETMEDAVDTVERADIALIYCPDSKDTQST